MVKASVYGWRELVWYLAKGESWARIEDVARAALRVIEEEKDLSAADEEARRLAEVSRQSG